MNAPIVLFGYNRPALLRRTLDALAANPEAAQSRLIVRLDGPRPSRPGDAEQTTAVRALARNIRGFQEVEIHESRWNRGLANSVIDGVSDAMNRFGRAIVLEDDLVASPYFLGFMNRALEAYADVPEVGAVTGFSPIPCAGLPGSYFLRGTHCWGWGAWARSWEKFETDTRFLLRNFTTPEEIRAFNFDGAYFFHRMLGMQLRGEVDSWFIRWNAALFQAGLLTLYPRGNLVTNTGFSGGTHYGRQPAPPETPLTDAAPEFSVIPIAENSEARRRFAAYYRSLAPVPPWRIRMAARIKDFLKLGIPCGLLWAYFRYAQRRYRYLADDPLPREWWRFFHD